MWAECGCTACELDNLDCENKAGKPRCVQFYGKDYKGFPYLRKFGEIGVVKQRDKIKSELVNRGEVCLYLGHAENHSADVARFMKLSTKRVIRSQDVKWLKKTFQECQESEGLYQGDEDSDSDSDHNSNSEDDDDSDPEDKDEDNNNNEPAATIETFCLSPHITRSGLRFALDDRSFIMHNKVWNKICP